MNEMGQVVELMGEGVGYLKAGQDIIHDEIKTVKRIVIGLSVITAGGFIYLTVKDHFHKKKYVEPKTQH